MRWGTNALEVAQAHDETEIYIHALSTIGQARLLAGERAGREQLEQARALAVDAGLEEQVRRADSNLIWVHMRQRDYALAYSYLEPALRDAGDRGDELSRGYLLADRARMELDLWPKAYATPRSPSA